MGVRSDISSSRSQYLSGLGVSIADGAVFVLCIMYSFWCVGERLVARDEGFYGYAAQLVLEGKTPYLDFFYPQMPVLPYLYAFGGVLAGGAGWDIFRGLSACCFAGILYLTYLLISKHSNWVFGVLGVILLGTCHLSFAWFTVNQTYALSVFLLMIGVAFLSKKESSFWSAFFTGLFFSLAVETRLFFLPVCIVPLISFWLEGQSRYTILKGFALGFLLASLPSGVLFFLAPESYLFSNLGYHLARSSSSFADEIAHKWRVFEVMFSLGRPSQKFDGFQTPLLFGALFLSLPCFFRLPRIVQVSSFIAILIFLVSFLPSPTYVQYFVAVVPFATIAVVLTFAMLYERQWKKRRTALVVLGCFTCVIYLKDVPWDMSRYFWTGKGVIGIGTPQQAVDWHVSRVKEVGSAIERYSLKNQPVLALWPGYLIGTKRTALQATENHFGYRAAEKLSGEEQERFHVVRIQEIAKRILNHEIPLVVGHRKALRSELRKALQKSGYMQMPPQGAVQLYRLVHPLKKNS